jgi:DNA-binding NarL/FixJ family response regulator
MSAMTLESIVVSADWQTIGVLSTVLNNLHISMAVDADPATAQRRLSRAKIDAVIVDCEVAGSRELLSRLRMSHATTNTVPMAVTAGQLELPELSTLGARFAFCKPVSVEQAVRTLSAARNLMLHGRLRYFRQPLENPVVLTFADRRRMDATITNLSHGGAAIRASHPLPSSLPVRVRFDLPGTDTFVEARGEVAWADQRGRAGIRFVEIPERLQRNLEQWLAGRYFAAFGN